MTTQGESNDQQSPGPSSNAAEAKGGQRRLFLLLGLLALALFALWYDYKVSRPAVEQAYAQITVTNDEINNASEHRRMTNADVQRVLGRSPSDTFTKGTYTIESYRWIAGMPIELLGLDGEDSFGIGLRTHHQYYAVYRKDGSELAFVTHFMSKLDQDYFAEPRIIAATDSDASAEDSMPSMEGFGGGPEGGGPGGPGGGGPGGGGDFDPEAFFAERDVDGDGKLAGDEISERMRGRLEDLDTDGDGAVSKEEFLAGRSQAGGRGGRGGPGGEGAGAERRQRPPLESSDDAPAAEAAPSDASPTPESKEAPAEPAPEKPATEPAPEATSEASEEAAQEESGSES